MRDGLIGDFMKFALSTALTATIVVILVVAAPPLQAAQPMPTDSKGRPLYVTGELAVKLRSNGDFDAAKRQPDRFGSPDLDAIADEIGVRAIEPMVRSRLSKSRPDLPDISLIYRVTVSEDVDVRRAALLLSRNPKVEYAEPIPAHYLHETPDDPLFDRQWFLENIDAEAAWDVHKGEEGAEVIVGISDSGVAWRHEDLVDNIYQNLGEDADGDGVVIVPSGNSWEFDPGDINGVDDDGNGYADDFVGWNLINDDRGQDNDPDDPGSHGTHVAGLAAARTDNGVGVSAVSWNVKILSTSASNSNSDDSIERGLGSIVYLAENGADIINMSWGSETTSRFEKEVIEYAVGLGSLLVSSAGNDNVSAPQYPSSLPGVLSVASVGKTDRLAFYSNYGISVDIAAPGGAGGNTMRSTLPGNRYGDKVGTSMASPVAAGVFALVKSLHPTWTNQQLIEQVLGTADNVDDLNTTYVGLMGAGRLNADRAVTDQPSIPNELRLEVVDIEVADETGDGSIEPGESADIFLDLRNYNHLVGSSAVTLTLESESEFIDIIDGEVTVVVAPDMSESLTDGFSIQIDDQAPTGSYDLTVSATASDASVSPYSELDLQIFVAGGGLLVWEGVEGGPTFSGQWLHEELMSRGYEVTYLTGDFPRGLVGFDGVFLSFGNAGIDPEGPPYSARLNADWKVEAIQSYLESGGRLFLDGSDTLGYDVYELVDGTVLLPLFGIESGVDGTEEHPLTSLDGYSGSLTEGMRFTATDQTPQAWIDIFTVGRGAEAFSESDYGVVAVQHWGRYGQKTFCMAYTLAELTDGSTTREDVLDAMIEFFDLDQSAGDEGRQRVVGDRVPSPAQSKLGLRSSDQR
jgi:subtilisin family serine protease